MAQPFIFISYSHEDEAKKESLLTHLKVLQQAGRVALWSDDYIKPGTDWQESISQAIARADIALLLVTANYLASDFITKEEVPALLSRQAQAGLKVIPIIAKPCAWQAIDWLAPLEVRPKSHKPIWCDDGGNADHELAIIVAEDIAAIQIYNLPEISSSKDIIPDCPYRGLFAFRPEHTHLFFGREAFIEKLVQAVESHSLMAVVGASGSGKSSVVLAGLVPALNATGLWLFTIFRPENDPFLGLASALVPLLYGKDLDIIDKIDKTRKLATKLRDEEILLSDIFKQIGRSYPDYRLLLITDQFEELYTLCRDITIRQKFLDMLLKTAGAIQDPFLHLVLTLRADFMGQALAYRPLADALQEADLKLGPMTRTELTEAIEKPAHLQNVRFEDRLVERILDDVGKEEGSLPLLEFALTELWQYQSQGTLSHIAYEKIGQARGALSRHADQVYTHLSSIEQEQTRRIFVQLVNPGTGTADTRRLASRSDLEPDWSLVTRLANERLVVTNKGEDSEETAELVHEALIRHWGQLLAWLEQDRAFLTWRLGLRADLKRWEEMNHDAGALLHGGPLAIAREMLANRPGDLSPTEQGFIQASVALQEQEAAEREARSQRELAQQRALAEEQRRRAEEQTQAAARLRRRAVWLAVAGVTSIILAVMAIIFGINASQNAAEAKRQADIAQSRQLAAQSSNELSKNNYELALTLAIESGHITDTMEAFSTIRAALAHPWLWYPQRVLFYGHSGQVLQATWSRDERRILTANYDGTARIWDAETGQELIKLEGYTGSVTQAIWSQDERRILTRSDDNTARLWDAETGQELLKLEGHTGSVYQATWSQDGHRILIASDDNTARIWDAESGQELLKLEGHTGSVYQAIWNQDESRILTRSNDGTARIWDAKSGQELTLEGHTGWVTQATWSRDGRRILTAGCDEEDANPKCTKTIARIWDAEDGQELLKLEGHTDYIIQAIWSQDEHHILTGSYDGTARVWDAESGRELLRLEGHTGPVNQVTWSRDERHILTGSYDSTARVWDAKTGQELLKLEANSGPGWQATWSRDGRHILTYSDDSTVRIWEAESGRELLKLEAYTSLFTEAIWSGDGRRILTRSADGTSRIWEARTHQELLKLEGNSGPVWQATWSQDGRRILTRSGDSTVRIWDAESDQELLTLAGHSVSQATWSRDGHRILTAGCDEYYDLTCTKATVRIWETETGQELIKLKGYTGPIFQATWSQDERRILTHSDDGIIRIWNAVTGQELIKLKGYAGSNLQATWSQDERHILTHSDDGIIRIWNAVTGQELFKLEGHAGLNLEATWSQDERHILTDGCDEYNGPLCTRFIARIWDAETGQELFKFESHTGQVSQTTWSQDGRRILTVECDRHNGPICTKSTARVWDVETGQGLFKLKSHTSSVSQATWNHDERRILTRSDDGIINIWDAETGQELLTLEGHSGPIGQVIWNHDKRRILTRSDDGAVNIWDIESGQELLRLEGDIGLFTQASWSRDERRILTASSDGTARIWDAESGQELLRLEGHTGSVTQATWSQDESRILTRSDDGTVRVWYTYMTDLIQKVACPRLPRNMTLEEWNHFMGEDYRPTCPEAPIPLDAVEAMAGQGSK